VTLNAQRLFNVLPGDEAEFDQNLSNIAVVLLLHF